MPTESYLKTFHTDLTSRLNAQARQPHTLRKHMALLFGFALLMNSLLVFYFYTSANLTSLLFHHIQEFKPVTWKAHKSAADIKISKATIVYEPSNSVFENVLRWHAEYDRKWGYETHTLRVPILKGAGDMLVWLQYLIVGEMMKSVEERVEWILYFDPSIIMSNNRTTISLDTFLPPVASTYDTFKALSIITTKPDNVNITSSILFLRVSSLILQILTLAIAAIYEPIQDLGHDIVASALQSVLEKDAYRDAVMYQPKEWYCDYESPFQQHWGGNSADRLLQIETTLDELNSEEPDPIWDPYPNAETVKAFWDTVIEARQMLREAKNRGYMNEEGEVEKLREAVEMRMWYTEGLRRDVELLKEKLGIGEAAGFESTIG